MDTLSGTVNDVRGPYREGWCILSVRPSNDKDHDPITVVGTLKDFQIGDQATFQGKWGSHPKYGKQFKATNATLEVPRDEEGLQAYLVRSFRWIGPVLARKLVEKFGDKLFDVIENSPQALAQVQGITAERASEIHTEFQKVKSDRSEDQWFAKHHITLNMRDRLILQYGSKAAVIGKIKANPYLLADEIWGIGFKKADAIALSIGIPRDSAVRVGACVRWILKEATSEGHVFLPQDELIAKCIEFISCDTEKVHEAVTDTLRSGKVVYSDANLYQEFLYRAETAVAQKLRAMAAGHHAQIMSNLTQDEISELDSDQQAALALALSSKVVIITGGPGVGKTFTTNKIIQALGGRKIELACPTGKASKRLSEMTGREARTIHRLLEFSPITGGFARGVDNPIECDTVLLDEMSMVDLPLMHSLLNAMTLDQQLIMVGDHHQLPSVGPGRVLADMIESSIIPVAYLKTLHRQAARSRINLNAKKINGGEKLTTADFNLPSDKEGDFWFCPEESAEAIPALIVKVIQAVPKQFGFEYDDIQVLCPQKRGPIGTQNLNDILRPVLNPEGVKIPGMMFQTGDRVIQTRNNYELAIFNGDIGIVSGADRDYLFVEFEDLKGKREVLYPISDTGDLQLAYALTIHKFQGSEQPVIIVPVHTTNFVMLKRDLLYTGITRGKKLVVLVGTLKAANIAIRTLDSSERYSNLKRWLVEGVNESHSEEI